MVYSIFACVADEESINEKKKKGQSLSKIEECPPVLLDKLSKLNDSKQLTDKVREEIFDKFSDLDYIAFGMKIISPSQIANKSYRRQKYSLNEISHNAAIELIKGLVERGVKIERVYVDTVGPMEKYQVNKIKIISLLFEKLICSNCFLSLKEKKISSLLCILEKIGANIPRPSV